MDRKGGGKGRMFEPLGWSEGTPNIAKQKVWSHPTGQGYMEDGRG